MSGKRAKLAAVLIALASVGVGLGAPDLGSAAIFPVQIRSFTATPSTTQAGGHPDVEIHSAFDNHLFVDGELIENPPSGTCSCADARIITTHLPTGFIGNPHAVPACTLSDFGLQQCAPESQVGIFDLGEFLGFVPIYNLETHPDEAGLIGFADPIAKSASFISIEARTGGDYGLDARSSPIFHLIPVLALDLYLWGVPADKSHDALRFPRLTPKCIQHSYPDPCFPPIPSNIAPEPYLQNPTTCGVTLNSSVDIEYYDGQLLHAENPWPGMTGCDQLSFNPSLTAKPTTPMADTAAGLDVDLRVPQPLSPTVPSASELKATTVTMPEGFSINPNAADGKAACTDAQAAFGTKGPAECPETSKVGTLEIDSSALPAPIGGAIYLGEPKPGNRYRLLLVADGFATHVKLPGTARLDSQTGQVVVAFEDLPQTTFQRFNMHFFGSERGLLATPTMCGTYPVSASFEPWNSALPNQVSTSSFTIDSGPDGSSCPDSPRPFDPSFLAGMADNTAATHSPFSVKLTRADGDQFLSSLHITTPPGFSATLAGVPYCPEAALAVLGDPGYAGLAEQARPTCPGASQIGTALTSEGAGSQPLHTPGKVYLAGPYHGAPLSLVVVVPAVSGPYDLGNEVVRTAIHIDPTTAQITAVSDQIPAILEGIPLRMRSILINLDRPNFTLNPSNCNPLSVNARIFGDLGAATRVSSHYQVSNCGILPFSPKLSIRMSGPSKRLGHPGLLATTNANPGDANIARVSVALPRTLQLDQSRINAPCTRVQFAAAACPDKSVLGAATARTPILDAPLSGPVYLVTSNHKLPDLVASLSGQVDIDLRGRIDSKDNRLRTTFETVPDVPVTSFRLDLDGGTRGLIINSSDLCNGAGRAVAKVTGQNGRRADQKPRLRVACANASHEKRRRSAQAGRDG
jgi:hypothetical protein